MFIKKPVGKKSKFAVDDPAEQRRSNLLARITSRKAKAKQIVEESESDPESQDDEPVVDMLESYAEPPPPLAVEKKKVPSTPRNSRSFKKAIQDEHVEESAEELTKEEAERLLRKAQLAEEKKDKARIRAKNARDARRELQRLDFEKRAREFVAGETANNKTREQLDDDRIQNLAMKLAKQMAGEVKLEPKLEPKPEPKPEPKEEPKLVTPPRRKFRVRR